MATYVIRVWMPDRPGALGAVASRIGAVGGDMVGIDILERGAGRAIDELVVELPDETLVPLLVSEICEVDGVDVEELRPAAESLRDPRLDALETAALLVERTDVNELLQALSDHACVDFDAEWAAVIAFDAPMPLARTGAPPQAAWLGAFVHGSKLSSRVSAGECGPDEVAWATMSAADLDLVIGRRGRPFRARERRQVAALARIADSRWTELVMRGSRLAHPSML